MPIKNWIIHFPNKSEMGEAALHPVGGISPECRGHHLRHVATEAIYALSGPKEHHVYHLEPCIGRGIEVFVHSTAPTIVYAIVELHGLIPIVFARTAIKLIVARGLGGYLLVISGAIHDGAQVQRITPTIVEVVERREMRMSIIILAKVFHALRLADGMILTSHMVGHEVHDNLHARLVGALYQGFPFPHPVCHVGGQVWVYVIIVANGVWRTSFSLDYLWMLAGNAIRGIICLCGMTNHARIPNMGNA